MKILVVDDDPINGQLLEHALRDDYEVHVTQAPREVAELVRRLSPDVVLLDVMMPDLDGLAVCAMLRADPETADTPVIFVTAVDSSEGQRAGLELGAVDYITKPLDLRLVKLRVRNHLEARRQRDLARAHAVALERKTAELEATLGRIKRLEGILSICMYCKKVRTEGAWQQLERYISEHSDAEFSHGMCPTCFDEHGDD